METYLAFLMAAMPTLQCRGVPGGLDYRVPGLGSIKRPVLKFKHPPASEVQSGTRVPGYPGGCGENFY
eukprot:748412-Rhodomonas_salina.2